MPKFDGTITGFVAGDNLTIRREITDLPAGESVAEAWFTVKSNLADADEISLVTKYIGFGSTEGEVEDDGGSNGIAIIRFDLLPEDTQSLYSPSRGTSGFLYDIQIKTANGLIYTPEVGAISANYQVTLRTEGGDIA